MRHGGFCQKGFAEWEAKHRALSLSETRGRDLPPQVCLRPSAATLHLTAPTADCCFVGVFVETQDVWRIYFLKMKGEKIPKNSDNRLICQFCCPWLEIERSLTRSEQTFWSTSTSIEPLHVRHPSVSHIPQLFCRGFEGLPPCLLDLSRQSWTHRSLHLTCCHCHPVE